MTKTFAASAERGARYVRDLQRGIPPDGTLTIVEHDAAREADIDAAIAAGLVEVRATLAGMRLLALTAAGEAVLG